MRDKQELVTMVLYNNPDAVSEQLAAMDIIDEGEYYDPTDLEAVIIQAAEYEMAQRGGSLNAYWEVVSAAVDVPIDMEGAYAIEIMNVHNTAGNRALLTSREEAPGFMPARMKWPGLTSGLFVVFLGLAIVYLIRKL